MRAASPGGLIDSEWPSISSPLLLGGQAGAGHRGGDLQPGAPLQRSRTTGAGPRGDTCCRPSPGHAAWCWGAGRAGVLGEVPKPCPAPRAPSPPSHAPNHIPPCHGHMALACSDAPGKGHGTLERAGRGMAVPQAHRAKYAADGMRGGALPRELNLPVEFGKS